MMYKHPNDLDYAEGTIRVVKDNGVTVVLLEEKAGNFIVISVTREEY